MSARICALHRSASIGEALLPRCRTTPQARSFSTTPCCAKMTVGRRKMFDWINSRQGRELAEPQAGPRYLGPLPDQPFPLNPLFRSQPVLDESTRELIWRRIIQQGHALKTVSAEMSIDVRRVAAVVRLKEVEKQWQRDPTLMACELTNAQGKKLATPYAKAVMRMLPKTSFREGEKNVPHESINEVHVHKYTMQQLFLPVSESRHFTREDAAKAFHDTLLSADARSPQAGLIKMEKDILQGQSREEGFARFRGNMEKEEESLAKKIKKQQKKEEELTTRVHTDRYEFRFKEIRVEDVGPRGRSRLGTGWRYGAPLDDRKRGKVKIPTSVP